jgi:hypothetical protein
MQVYKSNENYYLSDDTLIVDDGRRLTIKSFDWKSSTRNPLLLRWMAQASNLHRGEGYI